MFAIVDTDNFGGDYPNEKFVGEPFALLMDAQRKSDELNGPHVDNPRWFKVVSLPYQLQPGFKP